MFAMNSISIVIHVSDIYVLFYSILYQPVLLKGSPSLKDVIDHFQKWVGYFKKALLCLICIDVIRTSPLKRRISLDNGSSSKKLKMGNSDSELGMFWTETFIIDVCYYFLNFV